MRVLVVDDEALARERMARVLATLEDVSLVGEADGAEAALARVAELDPDVMLLDIEMPGMNGLELARCAGLPPIVFTTGHVDFAAEAFDVEAVDFVTKPVRKERLERALHRAHRRVLDLARKTNAPAPRLAVYDGGTLRFVDPAEITVFRARDKYTEFSRAGEELLVRESLDALETKLGSAFVRVHRAALVRANAIVAVESRDARAFARLADGSSIEVSRRAAHRVKDAARRAR